MLWGERDALRQDILDYLDTYQHEQAKRFGVTQNAIFLALRKLGLTFKKILRHPEANEGFRLSFREKTKRMKLLVAWLFTLTKVGLPMI